MPASAAAAPSQPPPPAAAASSLLLNTGGAAAAEGRGGTPAPLPPARRRTSIDSHTAGVSLNALAHFKGFSVIYNATRSCVWRCSHRLTNATYALKGYKIGSLSQIELDQVRREYELACAPGPHPCILTPLASFEDSQHIYLVQEFADQSDLFDVAGRQPGGRLSEAFAAQVMLQATMAVCACHEAGVAHRDIKPENLMMTQQGLCLLADFGLAIDLKQNRPVSRVGTLEYLAPEIATMAGTRDERAEAVALGERGAYYDAKVDVWSLGCLAYELLTGASPFTGADDAAVTKKIVAHVAGDHYGLEASGAAKDFILACLHPLPGARASAHALLRQPWLAAAAALLECNPLLLGCAPEARESTASGGAAARLLAARTKHLEWERRSGKGEDEEEGDGVGRMPRRSEISAPSGGRALRPRGNSVDFGPSASRPIVARVPFGGGAVMRAMSMQVGRTVEDEDEAAALPKRAQSQVGPSTQNPIVSPSTGAAASGGAAGSVGKGNGSPPLASLPRFRRLRREAVPGSTTGGAVKLPPVQPLQRRNSGQPGAFGFGSGGPQPPLAALSRSASSSMPGPASTALPAA